LQFCPSCGKSVEPGSTFCPSCGYNLSQGASQAKAPAPAPAVSQAPPEPPKPEVPLTEAQVAAGERGLTSAVLNFLFWGVGYYQAGIKRPFSRPWLIWPAIYIVYVFVSELILFNLHSAPSIGTVTVPIGNSSAVTSTSGFNPFPGLADREIEFLVLLVIGIVIGLFLARDAYRRQAASSSDPAAVPGIGAAIGSVVQRMTKQVNAQGVERDPSIAFTLVGGVFLILGSLYLMGLDWLSAETFDIGGIKELEGAVLGAIVIYLAIAATSRPNWRQPAGIFIIAIALVELTMSSEYVSELGFGLTIIGGALVLASSLKSGETENR